MKQSIGYLAQRRSFVLHAPRQSGKTTLLEALAKHITAEGKYAALRFSCETGQAFGSNVKAVALSIENVA